MLEIRESIYSRLSGDEQLADLLAEAPDGTPAIYFVTAENRKSPYIVVTPVSANEQAEGQIEADFQVDVLDAGEKYSQDPGRKYKIRDRVVDLLDRYTDRRGAENLRVWYDGEAGSEDADGEFHRHSVLFVARWNRQRDIIAREE